MKIYHYSDGPAVFINDEKVYIKKSTADMLEFGFHKWLENKAAERLQLPTFVGPNDSDLIEEAEKYELEIFEKGNVRIGFIFLDGVVIHNLIWMNGQRVSNPDPKKTYEDALKNGFKKI